jgi:HAMP domain-containing protein
MAIVGRAHLFGSIHFHRCVACGDSSGPSRTSGERGRRDMRFAPLTLGTRFVLVAGAVAALALAGLVALTLFGLDRLLTAQSDEVARFSQERLAEDLDVQAKLARQTMEAEFQGLRKLLQAHAGRADWPLAIAEARRLDAVLLDIKSETGFDGLFVLDANLKPLATTASPMRMEGMESALRAAELDQDLAALRTEGAALNRFGAIDSPLAAALGSDVSPLGLVVAARIGGDGPKAIIVGYRTLKSREPRLDSLARLVGLQLVVFSGDTPVSLAGLGDRAPRLAASTDSRTPGLDRSGDGRIARCVDYGGVQLCAVKSLADLQGMTAGLMQAGALQSSTLALWLLVFALVALTASVLIAHLAAREVTRPLADIAEALADVAHGDVRRPIAGADRPDEIGDIARRVTLIAGLAGGPPPAEIGVGRPCPDAAPARDAGTRDRRVQRRHARGPGQHQT